MKGKHDQTIEQFALRLPKDLMERVRVSAEENLRSLNNEIVWVLRQYYAEHTREQAEGSHAPSA